MTELCIREFRFETDFARATGLWIDVGAGVHLGASDAPAEILKKLRHAPELFLVAEADGVLIGTVVGGFDGRRGLIHHLAVHPGYQGQGIGSHLMDEVETRLRAKGCIRCWLLVGTDNAAAIDFYEKGGWKPLPDIPYAKDLV